MNEKPAASAPEGQAPGAQSEAVAGRAFSAGAWTIVTYGASQVLRLAVNLVLTRILAREAFGLMALVAVFLQALTLFSDIGAGQAIIQDRRGNEPEVLDTVFTLQVSRGFVLWLLTCAAAVPYAAFYGTPELVAVLPVAGFNAVLSGFNSNKLFTANRDLEMARMSIVELASQVIGCVGMLAWALVHPDVWALVFGGTLTSAAKLWLSHAILPGRRDRLRWDATEARRILGFSRWIFLSTALTFMSAQSDRLVFGKLVSLGMLGVYNIAMMLASVASAVFSRLAYQVVFAVLSRVFEDDVDPHAAFARVRRPLLVFAGATASVMLAAGPALVSVLYDERYADAGWILRILAVGAWVNVVESTLSAAALARGRPQWLVGGASLRFAGLFVVIPTGYALGGFAGAMWGFVLSDLLRYAVVHVGARAARIHSLRQDFEMTLLVSAGAVLGGGVAELLAGALGHSLPARAVVVAGASIVAALPWLPLLWREWRERRSTRDAAPSAVSA